jgi:deazaflavin-dependent oxidoreductase (nitroreductase family)
MTEGRASAGRASAGTDFNGKIIAEFRANAGKVGGPFAGSDILLLHHTGARTGTQRVSPLAFLRVGESFAIFASKAGGPSNPDWYHNLLAHARATVEVGSQTIAVTARVAEPTERDTIYDRQKQRNPAFAQYEERAAPRKIPVVVLDPVQ